MIFGSELSTLNQQKAEYDSPIDRLIFLTKFLNYKILGPFNANYPLKDGLNTNPQKDGLDERLSLLTSPKIVEDGVYSELLGIYLLKTNNPTFCVYKKNSKGEFYYDSFDKPYLDFVKKQGQLYELEVVPFYKYIKNGSEYDKISYKIDKDKKFIYCNKKYHQIYHIGGYDYVLGYKNKNNEVRPVQISIRDGYIEGNLSLIYESKPFQLTREQLVESSNNNPNKKKNKTDYTNSLSYLSFIQGFMYDVALINEKINFDERKKIIIKDSKILSPEYGFETPYVILYKGNYYFYYKDENKKEYYSFEYLNNNGKDLFNNGKDLFFIEKSFTEDTNSYPSSTPQWIKIYYKYKDLKIYFHIQENNKYILYQNEVYIISRNQNEYRLYVNETPISITINHGIIDLKNLEDFLLEEQKKQEAIELTKQKKWKDEITENDLTPKKKQTTKNDPTPKKQTPQKQKKQEAIELTKQNEWNEEITEQTPSEQNEWNEEITEQTPPKQNTSWKDELSIIFPTGIGLVLIIALSIYLLGKKNQSKTQKNKQLQRFVPEYPKILID
jgi:hypothetical protein